jgi:hypothetical protein
MITLTNRRTSTSLDQRLTMKVMTHTLARVLPVTTLRHLKRCKKLPSGWAISLWCPNIILFVSEL